MCREVKRKQVLYSWKWISDGDAVEAGATGGSQDDIQQVTVMPVALLLHALAALLQDAFFFATGYDDGVVRSMMSTTIGGLDTAKKASADDLGVVGMQTGRQHNLLQQETIWLIGAVDALPGSQMHELEPLARSPVRPQPPALKCIRGTACR